MSRTLRVIVVNTDDGVATDLRSVLLSIDGVKIVAEIDEPAMLAHAITHFPAEVLLVHLDPNPAGVMDVVAPLIEAHKDRIAVIGMTEDRDAELIMRAMRAGMREFLWKPFPPEQLAEVLNRVGSETSHSGRRLGRLFVAVGAGGGVGTTQLATNLAVELAQLEEWENQTTPGARPRVVVVDMDFRFGQVAMQLDAQPAFTIAELCERPEQIDAQMIEKAVFRHSAGVHVLARPNVLAEAERIHASQCAGVLASLQEHYDFVVVDLPGRFDPTARAVYDMADAYLLVMQLHVPCVRTVDRMLGELSVSGYAVERVRLACNRTGRESSYLEIADVESTLNRKIDFQIPEDWKTSSTALNMGSPLLLSAPKTRLRQAYVRIAQVLAGGRADAAGAGEDNGEAKGKKLFAFFGAAKSGV
ncbi:MAG: response regulator [Phycisphaerae bacterium]